MRLTLFLYDLRAGEQFAGRTPLLCGWLLVIKELSAVSYMKVPTIADVVCHILATADSVHIYIIDRFLLIH